MKSSDMKYGNIQATETSRTLNDLSALISGIAREKWVTYLEGKNGNVIRKGFS